MTISANEQEIREFFLEAKSGVRSCVTSESCRLFHFILQIIRVNYPNNFPGKAQKMAYVEFGDEEAMKAALARHAEASPSRTSVYLVPTF